MLLVLPDTAVLAIPYPCRLSLHDTFAKHTLSTYYVHQLCQSVEDTDLLLKDTQGVGRADTKTGNYAVLRCWGGNGGMPTEAPLGSHSGLASGWEASATCLACFLSGPAFVPGKWWVPRGNPERRLSKQNFHTGCALLEANQNALLP